MSILFVTSAKRLLHHSLPWSEYMDLTAPNGKNQCCTRASATVTAILFSAVRRPDIAYKHPMLSSYIATPDGWQDVVPSGQHTACLQIRFCYPLLHVPMSRCYSMLHRLTYSTSTAVLFDVEPPVWPVCTLTDMVLRFLNSHMSVPVLNLDSCN
jgi:hypothetical protein